MKHNLFSARGLPEFPDSEWVKIIQGKAIDLDIIISSIHSTVMDNCTTESFGEFEFWFGHSKPTKHIRNHRDWLIAYGTFQHVMWFIYLHREAELIWYREYITAYFASSDPAGQGWVINLNKAIQRWSGLVNNVSLDQFKKFRFLEVWHIFGKATGDQSGSQNQWGGGSGWWSKDAC